MDVKTLKNCYLINKSINKKLAKLYASVQALNTSDHIIVRDNFENYKFAVNWMCGNNSVNFYIASRLLGHNCNTYHDNNVIASVYLHCPLKFRTPPNLKIMHKILDKIMEAVIRADYDEMLEKIQDIGYIFDRFIIKCNAKKYFNKLRRDIDKSDIEYIFKCESFDCLKYIFIHNYKFDMDNLVHIILDYIENPNQYISLIEYDINQVKLVKKCIKYKNLDLFNYYLSTYNVAHPNNILRVILNYDETTFLLAAIKCDNFCFEKDMD